MADGKKVSFGENIPGYEWEASEQPALILIQEWWGVTDIVKAQAAMFASNGYRVLIPDLYKGTIGVDREEAGHLLTSLDYHLAVEEIGQAVEYLRGTGSPKVGVTGGCMGGALSFAAAQHAAGLSCAAPWYGTPAREMPWIEVQKITIPVQYHTGMLDRIRGFSDPQNAIQVTNRMKAAGCDVELYLYEDTPHSFMNAMVGQEGVDFLNKWDYGVPPQEQVQLCYQRLQAFFDKHLKH